MSKGCIFVGGVHGSGKTTLCECIQKELNCHYISASQLLNWSKKEKNVENVEENQKKLKELLVKEMQNDELYLIDGHFALWNEKNECEKVPLDFFCGLSIKCLVLAEESENVISKRLLIRSRLEISADNILKMMIAEKEQAQYVCSQLGIPIYKVHSCDKDEVKLTINLIGEKCRM